MSTNYIDQITDTAGTTHDVSEGDSTRIFRATCSTAANTASKVATLQTSNRNFSLSAGVRVAVTFTYGNTATTPTLRVDGSSTGTAKTIAVATSSTAKATGNGGTYNTWGPYETVIFTYDGTYWVNGGSSLSIYNAYNQAASAGSGTITEVKTNAGAHTTIDVTSGKAEFNVPTTAAHVGAATSDHVHGNITNGGDITATAPTIANGDQIIINDDSASKITNGPTFDGSTTTTALTPKGTWESFSKTDEKLSVSELQSGATGLVIVSQTSISTASTKHIDSTGFRYYTQDGTSNIEGKSSLTLGNSTTVGNEGNKTGQLILYGSNSAYSTTLTAASDNSNNKTITLPNGSGTLALTSDIPDFTDTITAWYGTSSTTASTTAKVVTCSNFALSTGVVIGVLFSTANTAATPTLNVNSTGAKSIYVGNSAPSSTTNVLKWSANTMVYFMYDGTQFRYITSVSAGDVAPSRGANTWYGTSSTSASTQAKTSTIDNYVLTKGSIVVITFSTANTYTSAKITLNINSTGAKDVYYNGAVTSSTNTLLWNANETLTFIYDGTGYYFVGKNANKLSSFINDAGFITSAPIITLNGSGTTSPTFYAPTGAGTSGQYLKSNGSGAPSWTSFPTIPSITLNGSSSTSPSFYAPTSAGTSGYYLKSNGSGAPSWTSFPTIPTKVSDLTNDSGFITTDSDCKLQVSTVTSGTTYYPIVGTGASAAMRQYDTNGFKYSGTNGTTSETGNAILTLGNSNTVGTDGNKQGQLVIYGSTIYAHTIQGAPSAARTLTLPNATGTIALTSDIPTNWLNGSATGSVRTSDSSAESSSYTIGQYAVVEGYVTTASSNVSHAEGYNTTASGTYSHTEGGNTTASGNYSHAGGLNTVAQTKSQTAIGEYNILDTTGTTTTRGDYAFIIGNGDSSARSNALTVDWNGNLAISGALHLPNLGSNDDTGSIKIADGSGNYHKALYCTQSNNLVLGYDWYNSSVGGTYIGGAPLYLRSTGADASLSAGLSMTGNLTVSGTTVKIGLGTSETLYTAINTAGWVSSVIVS